MPLKSLLFALLALPGPLAAQAPPKEIDAAVNQALKRFNQPGAAIAVVKDGKVVFQQGWGVRRLGESARVDAHTRFQVASNTKAMTAAAIAILVADGKLKWDAPVANYLPWFRLGGDPYVSRELTVRDLLCHRSGLSLGAGDLLWFHSDYSSAEIARRLRFIAPATSFRSGYAYDNVLYIVAGELIKEVSGMPWGEFVTRRILEPIGMSETVTNLTAIAAGENLASPHGTLGGPMQVVPFDSVDNIEAAGGVVSSAADWSRWMLTQLDSGRIAGTTVWPSAQTRELWSPGIPVPIGDPPAPLLPLRPNFSAYGLGWSLRDYRGVKLVTHDGGLAGMLSRTILVPEKRLGIVIFTNGETLAYQALGWTVLDYYLGAPRTDWTSIIATLGEQAQSSDRAFEDSIQAARHAESGPSLPLAQLAGRYTDEWYGDVTLALEGDHLVLHWSHSPALVADLEHWQYDTFRARMRTPNVADAFLTFQLKYDGTVDRITMAPVLPSTDFSFNYQDLVFRPGQ